MILGNNGNEMNETSSGERGSWNNSINEGFFLILVASICLIVMLLKKGWFDIEPHKILEASYVYILSMLYL